MIQTDLHEDYDPGKQFCFDEFPLENSILVSCRKDLVCHFTLGPYSYFHYFVRKHFSFVNDYISVIYPYQAVVIKCEPCYRKSVTQEEEKMKKIKFVRFYAKAKAPKRATVDSAGYDLYSAENCTIKARSVYPVTTVLGIQNQYVKLVGKIYSRSSMAIKQVLV